MHVTDVFGLLSREEIGEAMAEMGRRPTEEELDEFFDLFDTVSGQ